MEYTNIYRNGKPQYFFIKIDAENEYNFLQPYFLLTSYDHPRLGRILEMDCLFSGSVWQGRQSHGYGYSCSADVYETLIDAIKKLHGKMLSSTAKEELNEINTHERTLTLSANLLSELATLNAAALAKKYNFD